MRLVVQHLLSLIHLLLRRGSHPQTQQQLKRPRTPEVNWMVAHGGLLGLNYLLSARSVSEQNKQLFDEIEIAKILC